MQYSPDRPIEKGEEDRFNRSAFAGRLASTIAHRADTSSLVAGIYGKWGEGKTSVLNLMRGVLGKIDSVVVIPFNPWQFGTQEQLLRAFFTTLAEGLDARLKTPGQSIGEVLKKYGGLLSLASVAVSGGAVSLNPGAAAEKLGEGLSNVELEKVREKIEEILARSGKRIVVLIDDIDRLDRREIQAVFKLVKLSANFPNTTYVLAFDSEMVGDALGESYGRGGTEAGKQFLEKIIQVPLYLPPADRATLRGMAFEGAEAALKLADIPITDELRHGFPHRFTDAFEPSLTTPRQVVRYANALTFALPITKGEVNPLDQLLIEGIRVFYPKLYLVIRDNPDCVLLRDSDRRDERDRKRIRDILDAGFVGLNPRERDAAMGILQALFPRLRGILGNGGGYATSWDVEWTRGKKICSTYYFSRYFTYAIGREDVADKTIESLVALADGASDQEAVDVAFGNLLAGTAARLIDRLRFVEEVLSPSAAKRLVHAVARNGESYPAGQGLGGFGAPFRQAAILVRNLLRRLAAPERDAVAQEVMHTAQPLTFALEYFGWIRSEDDSEQRGKALLSLQAERAVVDILLQRIRETSQQTPPYIQFAEMASSILWVWGHYGRENECRDYLMGRFNGNSAEIVQFLAALAPTAWIGELAVPVPGDLERNGYDAACRLVDPRDLADRLQAMYGSALKTDDYERSRDMPNDLRLASQFVYLFRHVRVEEPRADVAPEAQDDERRNENVSTNERPSIHELQATASRSSSRVGVHSAARRPRKASRKSKNKSKSR